MKESEAKPNEVTYNSLIDTCVRCGKMSKAWILLKEMQEQMKPDNFTYSTLIKGIKPDFQSTQSGHISNMQDLEKAFALLAEMKKRDEPDEEDKEEDKDNKDKDEKLDEDVDR